MERLQKRLKFQELLEELAKPFVKKSDKSSHVYYNPPTGFKLEYPCIVYNDSAPLINYADNARYFNKIHWQLTTMSRDPESADLAPLVEALPYVSYTNSFVSDNIAHRVYDVYF